MFETKCDIIRGGFRVKKKVVTSFCKIHITYTTVITFIFDVIIVMIIIVFIINIVNVAITVGYWSMIIRLLLILSFALSFTINICYYFYHHDHYYCYYYYLLCFTLVLSMELQKKEKKRKIEGLIKSLSKNHNVCSHCPSSYLDYGSKERTQQGTPESRCVEKSYWHRPPYNI